MVYTSKIKDLCLVTIQKLLGPCIRSTLFNSCGARSTNHCRAVVLSNFSLPWPWPKARVQEPSVVSGEVSELWRPSWIWESSWHWASQLSTHTEFSVAWMGAFPLGWISPYTSSWFYFGFKPTRTLYYKYSVLLRYKMYKYNKWKQTWRVRSESLLPFKPLICRYLSLEIQALLFCRLFFIT